MVIFGLLNLYPENAVNIREKIERLKLAKAGLFGLFVLARACGSWHVNIDQLAVLALNLELKEGVTVFSEKPARNKKGIYRYLGSQRYLIKLDIALVELYC